MRRDRSRGAPAEHHVPLFWTPSISTRYSGCVGYALSNTAGRRRALWPAVKPLRISEGGTKSIATRETGIHVRCRGQGGGDTAPGPAHGWRRDDKSRTRERRCRRVITVNESGEMEPREDRIVARPSRERARHFPPARAGGSPSRRMREERERGRERERRPPLVGHRVLREEEYKRGR